MKVKEFLKKNVFYLAALIAAVFANAVVMIHNVDVNRNKQRIARNHINLAMKTEKICSSCHFGDSFVNLFSNKNIAGNDNVISYILDEVKVKRW